MDLKTTFYAMEFIDNYKYTLIWNIDHSNNYNDRQFCVDVHSYVILNCNNNILTMHSWFS